MTPGLQAGPPVLTRAALSGLAVGAAVSSLLGAGIFAGFVAVALTVGVVLALEAVTSAGRVLSVLGGAVAMLFPLAVVQEGEGGILWAAAASVMVLPAGYVLKGQRPGTLKTLAVSLAVVLYLGLLASYLVLTAVAGNRLLPALVLMAVAFETAYAVVSAPSSGSSVPHGKRRREPPRAHTTTLGKWINLKGALAGVVACQLAAVGARFFLPSAPGLISSMILGAVVGAGAILGHASAVAILQDFRNGAQSAMPPSVLIPHLNALLFAAGVFYYGFRLYLA